MKKKFMLAGDSLIEFFNWQKRFPNYTVINSGIAGETVQGLLRRVRYALPEKPAPDCLLIMIGTNNLVMEDYGFRASYEELLEFLRKQYSDTFIILNSLLPLQLPWLAPTAIPRINEQINKLAEISEKTCYLDAYSAFEKGAHPVHTLFDGDGVHLSELGYSLWASVIEEFIISSLP